MKSKSVITQLTLAVKEDEIALYLIKETLNACSKYVDLIHQQEVVATVDKYRMTKEDLLYSIRTLDEHRHMVHEVIISGIKKLNLMCMEHGLDKFYEGDTEDRVAVGEFAMNIVEDSFKNRKK